MSRSIHKTLRGVFGGKSRQEVDSMFEEDDPDVQDLRRKSEYKEEARRSRSAEGQSDPREASPDEVWGAAALEYVEARLRKVTADEDGRRVAYVDDETGDRWELDYSDSGLKGEGSPRLRRVGST